MPALTMDHALAIIQHTFAHAKKLNAYAFGAIVLDAGGQVVA